MMTPIGNDYVQQSFSILLSVEVDAHMVGEISHTFMIPTSTSQKPSPPLINDFLNQTTGTHDYRYGTVCKIIHSRRDLLLSNIPGYYPLSQSQHKNSVFCKSAPLLIGESSELNILDMSENEIITLQIGTYANFVGSHLWNLRNELTNEDEENYEQHVRNVYYHDSGLKLGYKPRCVAVDLNENFGSNCSEQDVNAAVAWEGNVHNSVGKFASQAETSNSSWSDVSKVSLYHLRIVCTWRSFSCDSCHRSNCIKNLFATFPNGQLLTLSTHSSKVA